MTNQSFSTKNGSSLGPGSSLVATRRTRSLTRHMSFSPCRQSRGNLCLLSSVRFADVARVADMLLVHKQCVDETASPIRQDSAPCLAHL